MCPGCKCGVWLLRANHPLEGPLGRHWQVRSLESSAIIRLKHTGRLQLHVPHPGPCSACSPPASSALPTDPPLQRTSAATLHHHHGFRETTVDLISVFDVACHRLETQPRRLPRLVSSLSKATKSWYLRTSTRDPGTGLHSYYSIPSRPLLRTALA